MMGSGQGQSGLVQRPHLVKHLVGADELEVRLKILQAVLDRC